jgi:hypothetical protein
MSINPWHNASNEPRFLTELDDYDERAVLLERIEAFLALVNGLKHEDIPWIEFTLRFRNVARLAPLWAHRI